MKQITFLLLLVLSLSQAFSQTNGSAVVSVEQTLHDNKNTFIYFCPKKYIFTDDGQFAPNLSLLETYIHRVDTINNKMLFIVFPKDMAGSFCGENAFLNMLMVLSEAQASSLSTYRSALSKNSENSLVIKFKTNANDVMYSDNPTRIIYSMGFFNYDFKTNTVKVNSVNNIIHYDTQDDRFRTQWANLKDKFL